MIASNIGKKYTSHYGLSNAAYLDFFYIILSSRFLVSIVRTRTPVQSNCDAQDTIVNGQFDATWNKWGTHCKSVNVLPPPKRLARVFLEICYPVAATN